MPGDWSFGTISVRHGTPARREISFVYRDGSPRLDLSGATGYLRVYADSDGTVPLFPEVAMLPGPAEHSRMLALTAAQCAQPADAYYAEIEFRDDAGRVIEDSGFYGMFSVAGK